MEFNLKIAGEDVKTIFDCLDQGPHNKVRRIIDNIFAQVQQQEIAAQQPKEPVPPVEPGQNAGGTD